MYDESGNGLNVSQLESGFVAGEADDDKFIADSGASKFMYRVSYDFEFIEKRHRVRIQAVDGKCKKLAFMGRLKPNVVGQS